MYYFYWIIDYKVLSYSTVVLSMKHYNCITSFVTDNNYVIVWCFPTDFKRLGTFHSQNKFATYCS